MGRTRKHCIKNNRVDLSYKYSLVSRIFCEYRGSAIRDRGTYNHNVVLVRST